MNEKPINKTSPEARDPTCADDAKGGPVREGGGTTGAGNLSEESTSRTGGATGGTPRAGSEVPKNKVPPSA